MATMYKTKDQKGLSIAQKGKQIELQAMDIAGRIEALQKKKVPIDISKMRILAKIEMLVKIFVETGMVEISDIDLYFQEELNKIISNVEKNPPTVRPKKGITIAKDFNFKNLKKNTGVN